jgi:hypothetical protein
VRRARAAFLAAAVAALVFVVPPPAGEALPCAGVRAAAGTSRAGLVVQFGDGKVMRYCVSFSEESITGYELLRRTGLPLVYQDYGAGSVAMCKIGDEGCEYPREQCFCRCRNTQTGCRFWGYYTIDRATGKWRLSEKGSGVRDMRNGDIDGWRWGTHQPNPNPPPASTLESLCAEGTKIGPAATTKATPKPAPSKATTTSPSTADSDPTTSTPTPGASLVPTAGATPGPPNDSPSAPPLAAPGPGKGGGAPPAAGLVAVGAAALGLGAWGAFRLRGARRAPP